MSSQWISVKDRLPEYADEIVLAWGDVNGEGHLEMECAIFEDDDWHLNVGSGTLRNVTHWMPLPAPPEPKLTVKTALSLAVRMLEMHEETALSVTENFEIRRKQLCDPDGKPLLPRLRAALESEE